MSFILLCVFRYYVQPQWVFDCINAKLLLPVEDYFLGVTLPPHLSPFVEEKEGDYVPPEKLKILALQRGEQPGMNQHVSPIPAFKHWLVPAGDSFRVSRGKLLRWQLQFIWITAQEEDDEEGEEDEEEDDDNEEEDDEEEDEDGEEKSLRKMEKQKSQGKVRGIFFKPLLLLRSLFLPSSSHPPWPFQSLQVKVTPGKMKVEDPGRLEQEEKAEEKRLAIMMMQKKEKYLYNKIMFGKKRKIREVGSSFLLIWMWACLDKTSLLLTFAFLTLNSFLLQSYLIRGW